MRSTTGAAAAPLRRNGRTGEGHVALLICSDAIGSLSEPQNKYAGAGKYRTARPVERSMMAPSTAERPAARALQANRTRQRLVAAAVELFSENTFDEVAVADIPKAAGVAHGLLFHYFGSKRRIYLEAMRQAAEELGEALVFRTELDPISSCAKHFDPTSPTCAPTADLPCASYWAVAAPIRRPGKSSKPPVGGQSRCARYFRDTDPQQPAVRAVRAPPQARSTRQPCSGCRTTALSNWNPSSSGWSELPQKRCGEQKPRLAVDSGTRVSAQQKSARRRAPRPKREL